MRVHGSVATAILALALVVGEAVNRAFPHLHRRRRGRTARHSAWLLAMPAVLAGCADQPAPSEPSLEQHSAGAAEMTNPVETHSRPLAETEALELPAGVRTAMTSSLTAALAEYDIHPDASMSTLHDFLRRVDAQQAERRQARADLLRTVHP